MAVHLFKLAVDQALISATDPENFHVVKYGCADHSPYCGIHTGGIAPGCQDTNSIDSWHVSSIFELQNYQIS
jgi:hypothetical protein